MFPSTVKIGYQNLKTHSICLDRSQHLEFEIGSPNATLLTGLVTSIPIQYKPNYW